MKVSELIEQLGDMPQDAQVYILYDGEPRLNAGVVYQSRRGPVIIAGNEQVVYSDAARPVGAPTEKENRYWQTIKEPPESYHEYEFD